MYKRQRKQRDSEKPEIVPAVIEDAERCELLLRHEIRPGERKSEKVFDPAQGQEGVEQLHAVGMLSEMKRHLIEVVVVICDIDIGLAEKDGEMIFHLEDPV